MKLFAGLGNPGSKYKDSRHNTGWLVLDAIASRISNQLSNFKLEKQFDAELLKVESIILAKPQTFMNESGKAVKKIVDFYKVVMEDLYVIHDDLDIRLGEYKIQKGVGPKVHGGINSIERELGKSDFWRVRVGVDNRELENRVSGEEYVLQEFSKGEIKTIEEIIGEILPTFTIR